MHRSRPLKAFLNGAAAALIALFFWSMLIRAAIGAIVLVTFVFFVIRTL